MGSAPECTKTRDGLATRDEVRHFLQAKLAVWSLAADGFAAPDPLTGPEMDEFDHAVAYLKASGLIDTQVKRWILKQRARRDYLNSRL